METYLTGPFAGYGSPEDGGTLNYFRAVRILPENMPCPYFFVFAADDPICPVASAYSVLLSEKVGDPICPVASAYSVLLSEKVRGR